MTPEERAQVVELFDRLATLEDAARDPEAERLIRDGLRQAPNAPYALVQTVLLQDEALKRANARMQELEGKTPAQETSFLGSMRESLFGRNETRGSVPSVQSGDTMSSAWRAGREPGPEGPPAATQAPRMGMGGSFLGTAASAAAGVIGGALLLDGIRSMMGHQAGAQAAYGAGGGSPWSGEGGGGELAREAGIDDIGQRSAGGSDDYRLVRDEGADAQDAGIEDSGFDFDAGSD
jgi:hypothetical protein